MPDKWFLNIRLYMIFFCLNCQHVHVSKGLLEQSLNVSKKAMVTLFVMWHAELAIHSFLEILHCQNTLVVSTLHMSGMESPLLAEVIKQNYVTHYQIIQILYTICVQ